MIVSNNIKYYRNITSVFQSLSTQKYIRIVESLHVRSTYPTSVRYLNLRSQSYNGASFW